MRTPTWIAGTLALVTAFSLASAPAAMAKANADGYFVVDNAGVYPNRGGEQWYCSLFNLWCGEIPQRPFNANDQPVWVGAKGHDVTIKCYKGSYYLVVDEAHSTTGWAVMTRAVRPYSGEAPNQCTVFDEAGQEWDPY